MQPENAYNCFHRRYRKLIHSAVEENNYQYQYGFADRHADVMYDLETRTQKAQKVLAVLLDYYSGETKNLKVLDIGCSIGIISYSLSEKFGEVNGIDIDKNAVKFATEKYKRSNLFFAEQDGMHLKYPAGSFDIVVCSHIYEHIPDMEKLMAEAYKVLKPGGICFFAAVNRLKIMEDDHRLPFLSILPRSIGKWYLRFFRKEKDYYERTRTYWGLRSLVAAFERIDYTIKILQEPEKFQATDMVKAGTIKQKLALLFVRFAYGFFPTYIWLLKKPPEEKC